MGLARQKLVALTGLVTLRHENEVEWGFNEWIKAQTVNPAGGIGRPDRPLYTSTPLNVWSSRTPGSLTRSARAIRARQVKPGSPARDHETDIRAIVERQISHFRCSFCVAAWPITAGATATAFKDQGFRDGPPRAKRRESSGKGCDATDSRRQALESATSVNRRSAQMRGGRPMGTACYPVPGSGRTRAGKKTQTGGEPLVNAA
jgi:hypothetical protein